MSGLSHGEISGLAACLPVTALQIVQYRNESLLLAGTGSFLALYRVSSPPILLFSARIFASQNIHGIVSFGTRNCEDQVAIRLFIWGGRLISCCDLLIADCSSKDDIIQIEIAKIRSASLEDWILHITILPITDEVVILTAHNNLLKLSPSANVDLESLLIAVGPQTLLYSGHVIASNQNHLLIASGSVFGEIVVWVCLKDEDTDQWTAETRHVFLGHRGSIFGVVFSSEFRLNRNKHRLLASCSDDRTIRVWDVTGCDDRGHTVNLPQLMSKVTGFGDTDEDNRCIAMAWGHLSRIWDVSFVQAGPFEQDDQIALLSRGEDGAFHYWMFDKLAAFASSREKVLELLPIYNDRHHAGKNAWSWVQTAINDQCLVFTGGADGQIIRRMLPTPTQMSQRGPKSIAFKQLMNSLQQTKNDLLSPSLLMFKALKQYIVFENGVIIASTDGGHLVSSSIKDFDNWTVIEIGKLKKTVTLSHSRIGDVAFIGRANGELAVFNASTTMVADTGIMLPGQASSIIIGDSTSTESASRLQFNLVVTIYGHHQPQLLILSNAGSISLIRKFDLMTPPDFTITSASYSTAQATLICGSRLGAVAVFVQHTLDQDTIESALCVRHVHGSDCITSVTCTSYNSANDNTDQLVLTTGRDGTYAVHRLRISAADEEPMLLTLHRSTPPLGPCIEGCYFQRDTLGNPSLILYGFKSTEFVVWDEMWQKQLLSVNCGGAHRSWSLDPGCLMEKKMAFLWTKAGVANLYRSSSTENVIVQEGGHGREIKSLAISPIDYGQGCPIIATGAEDTDIRLFRVKTQLCHSQNSQPIHCIRVLKGHTTGIQHLKFSACGRFLFSSAGREEMFIWKITQVPLIEIGTVLVAQLPKEAEDSDARIMSFDVVDRAHHNVNTDEVRISMAYSNGKIKVFCFLKQSSRIVFEGEHVIGPLCLSQASHLSPERLLVAATDGHLRIVDHLHDMKEVHKHRIHQSNISSMDIRQLDSPNTLVVSGGDDNALGVSLFQGSEPFQCTTFLVPSAHAAAVTAVAVLKVSSNLDTICGIVASAGNDQKVRLWRIEVPVKQNATEVERELAQRELLSERAKLTKLREYWTDVADVSDIGILTTQGGKGNDSTDHRKDKSMLIVGVGMQVIQFN